MVTMHVCNWLILMGMVLSETDVMLIKLFGAHGAPLVNPLKFLRQPNGFSEVFRWQRQERDLENLEMCWFGNALWPEGPKLIFLCAHHVVFFFRLFKTGCILRIWKHAALAQPDHWGNLLGFDGAVALSRGLRGWPAPGCRLQVLTLRENRLGDGGVGAIAEASGEGCEVFWWIINGSMEKSPIKVTGFNGKRKSRISEANAIGSCSGIDRGLGRQCGPQRIRSPPATRFLPRLGPGRCG